MKSLVLISLFSTLAACSFPKTIPLSDHGAQVEVIDSVDLGGLASFKRLGTVECRRDQSKENCITVLRNKAALMNGIAIKIEKIESAFCENTVLGQLAADEAKCFSGSAVVYGKR